MKVILLENVAGLGRAGDIKVVKDGYARNYLLPKKLAEIATKNKEEYIKKLSEKLAEKAQKVYEDAVSLKNQLEDKVIEIFAKAGEEGKLFGSVTSTLVAEELKKLGFEIDKKKILMDHIKVLGEYKIRIRLDEGVIANIKLIVKPQQ